MNVWTSGNPYLAAIVEENDGEYIKYFHPFLKGKKIFKIPHRFVQPFQPQWVDGKLKL